MTTYTRQSSFGNGDVIDANVLNNEFDAMEVAMAASGGHQHDGIEGTVIPFVGSADGASGIFVDDSVVADHNIVFTLDGVEVLRWKESEPTNLMQTDKVMHTPVSSGVPEQLVGYLDTLEVSVGDAATDAAAAAQSAEDAQNAAMIVGVPTVIADAGTFVVAEDALLADVIFVGDGTFTLPVGLVVGRRFYIHVHLMAIGKTVQIPTGAHTITGNIGTVLPANILELQAGDVIVLEVVSLTELEIL